MTDLLEFLDVVEFRDNQDGTVTINDKVYSSQELAELIYKLTDTANDFAYILYRHGNLY